MPVTFSQQERRALLRVLRAGRRSAISAKRLAEALGYPASGNQVRLRSLIKECIENDNDLIGAATGRPVGFFKIATVEELEKYIDTLEGRIRSDNDRRTALINSWNNRPSAPTSKHPLRVR